MTSRTQVSTRIQPVVICWSLCSVHRNMAKMDSDELSHYWHTPLSDNGPWHMKLRFLISSSHWSVNVPSDPFQIYVVILICYILKLGPEKALRLTKRCQPVDEVALALWLRWIQPLGALCCFKRRSWIITCFGITQGFVAWNRPGLAISSTRALVLFMFSLYFWEHTYVCITGGSSFTLQLVNPASSWGAHAICERYIYNITNITHKHSSTLLLISLERQGSWDGHVPGGCGLAYMKDVLSRKDCTGTPLKISWSSSEGERMYPMAIWVDLMTLETLDGISRRVAPGQAYLVAWINAYCGSRLFVSVWKRYRRSSFFFFFCFFWSTLLPHTRLSIPF